MVHDGNKAPVRQGGIQGKRDRQVPSGGSPEKGLHSPGLLHRSIGQQEERESVLKELL